MELKKFKKKNGKLNPDWHCSAKFNDYNYEISLSKIITMKIIMYIWLVYFQYTIVYSRSRTNQKQKEIDYNNRYECKIFAINVQT